MPQKGNNMEKLMLESNNETAALEKEVQHELLAEFSRHDDAMTSLLTRLIGTTLELCCGGSKTIGVLKNWPGSTDWFHIAEITFPSAFVFNMASHHSNEQPTSIYIYTFPHETHGG